MPFKEAEETYIKEQYDMMGKIHYSLPPEKFLHNDHLLELLSLAARAEGKNVNFPPDDIASNVFFDWIKDFCQEYPSLVIRVSIFCKTLREAVLKKLRTDRRNTALSWDERSIFFTYPSGQKVYSIFFLVKSTNLKEDAKTVNKSVVDAIRQSAQQILTFSTVCRSFLGPEAIVLGFPAFPFILKKDLQAQHICCSCLSKMITSDDLQNMNSFHNFLKSNGVANLPNASFSADASILFSRISSRQICAFSSADVARTHYLNFTPRSYPEMGEKALCILTPNQKCLVDDKSECVFIAGGSGTGKTLVLKERAKRLSMEGYEVLVVNIAGGLLTQDFKEYFQG